MKVRIDGWAWLESACLTTEQKRKLRQDLTIYPHKAREAKEDPKPVYLFREEGEWFGVPRSYYLPRRKITHEITDNSSRGEVSVFREFPLKFNGTLRDEQQVALRDVTEASTAGAYGAIIKAVPGWGKTICACAIISEMATPTLVVVHKEFLMNQWKERIAKFLPGAKVGTIQGDVCDYKDKHIVLGMVHTLCSRDFPKDVISYFGLMVVDENHRVGAATWSKAPPKFTARFRLGVSGTPKRKDGADDVFFYHLGPIIFRSKEVRLAPKVRRIYTNFAIASTPKFNPNLAPKPLLVRFLCANPMRNKQITEQLIQAVQAGRKVLVLSERLKHLDALEMMLLQAWRPEYGERPTTGKYVGGMTEDELEESETKQVIFATSQYAQEGLDIPALDTLFLTCPMVDIIQAAGRILRPYLGKKDPVIVDFIDERVPMFKKFAEARERNYKKIIDGTT